MKSNGWAPVSIVKRWAALSAGARTSFVDQVSFAVMRRRGITEALALDADFVAAGFDLFGATAS